MKGPALMGQKAAEICIFEGASTDGTKGCRDLPSLKGLALMGQKSTDGTFLFEGASTDGTKGCTRFASLKGLALMGQKAAETCIFEGVSTDRFFLYE